MKSYRKHPAVPAEIEAAARWYEERETGLGEEFLSAIEDAIAILCEAPAVWPRWPDVPEDLEIRRYVMQRFPFAIACLDEPREVVVLAVAHARRAPRYWLYRR